MYKTVFICAIYALCVGERHICRRCRHVGSTSQRSYWFNPQLSSVGHPCYCHHWWQQGEFRSRPWPWPFTTVALTVTSVLEWNLDFCYFNLNKWCDPETTGIYFLSLRPWHCCRQQPRPFAGASECSVSRNTRKARLSRDASLMTSAPLTRRKLWDTLDCSPEWSQHTRARSLSSCRLMEKLLLWYVTPVYRKTLADVCALFMYNWR